MFPRLLGAASISPVWAWSRAVACGEGQRIGLCWDLRPQKQGACRTPKQELSALVIVKLVCDYQVLLWPGLLACDWSPSLSASFCQAPARLSQIGLHQTVEDQNRFWGKVIIKWVMEAAVMTTSILKGAFCNSINLERCQGQFLRLAAA